MLSLMNLKYQTLSPYLRIFKEFHEYLRIEYLWNKERAPCLKILILYDTYCMVHFFCIRQTIKFSTLPGFL